MDMEVRAGQEHIFFDRDLSWLCFGESVPLETGNSEGSLLERIRFLSIYSSNSDEFYRVRMPALMALDKINRKKDGGDAPSVLQKANAIIHRQQELFGTTLADILPELRSKNNSHLVYKEPIPEPVQAAATDYFFTQVLAFLQPVYLSDRTVQFFPENNKLYLVAIVSIAQYKEEYIILNIPSDLLPRFYSVQHEGIQYILFLDDIIRYNLQAVMPQVSILSSYSFKVTRDAELGLEDEYEGDMAEKIEKQIAKRDFGFATRFLYGAGLPARCLQALMNVLHLSNANVIEGGMYHNLKDLASLPITDPALMYPHWPVTEYPVPTDPPSLLEEIIQKDIILHPPYQSYNTVLRFFNEAAIDPWVEEIYVTLYRIAGDSKIAYALMSAARNGKKVTVFVELKARFDEANNIRWSKQMKAAGVKIVYSIPSLKVHAKVALIKKVKENRSQLAGLLATGNLNESTARFYTDHILLTAHPEMLRELEMLFSFLAERRKPVTQGLLSFSHLLVAQFNLQDRFLSMIEREIRNAQQGLPARIFIKLNNLEEKVMIGKLYEASAAGVKVDLIVRSICCLVPGVRGLSERITVKRIVDRYLEHGRIFIFHNNGHPELFLGSADWMNRNIYRRIEVCFPIYDPVIKQELMELMQVQWQDNVQAALLDSSLSNCPIDLTEMPIRSQKMISETLRRRPSITN